MGLSLLTEMRGLRNVTPPVSRPTTTGRHSAAMPAEQASPSGQTVVARPPSGIVVNEGDGTLRDAAVLGATAPPHRVINQENGRPIRARPSIRAMAYVCSLPSICGDSSTTRPSPCPQNLDRSHLERCSSMPNPRRAFVYSALLDHPSHSCVRGPSRITKAAP